MGFSLVKRLASLEMSLVVFAPKCGRYSEVRLLGFEV